MMNRTIADILDNLDHVGCDNETARELCEQVQRLHELKAAALAWYDAEHAAAALDLDKVDTGELWAAMRRGQESMTRLWNATKAIKEGEATCEPSKKS